MKHSDLKKRKESVRKLRSIISTLRSIASLQVQQTGGPVKGMREYRKILAHSIARFKNYQSKMTELNDTKSKDLLIVFGSEFGFVGGFNRAILDEINSMDLQNAILVFVGSRGYTLASEFDLKIDFKLSMCSDHNTAQQTVREISALIFKMVNEGVNSVKLVYVEKEGTSKTEIQQRPLFPVEVTKFSKSGHDDELPLLNMPPAELLEHLVEEYIMASLSCAVLESLHSENYGRLNAMDQAYKNISKKYKALEHLSHLQSQEEITTELFDIITGFMAQKTKILPFLE